MSMEKFHIAIEKTLAHEGGYVDDPDDPGGETNYGISKRSYPDVDIKNLTKRAATEIYYRDFWMKYSLDSITDTSVASKIFDLIVNMGPRAGIRVVQRACRAMGTPITQDGIIGPVTISTVNKYGHHILPVIRSEAAGRYRIIAMNMGSKFLKGWLNRAYS